MFKNCKLLLCLGLFFGAMPYALAAPVGEVIFSVGDAHLAGANRMLKRGDQVDVGHAVVTGVNGHVHLKFNDGAFVSVRPGSELHVEQYVYDQSNPDNNRIKFNLVKGTSRLITGKAGQAAKQNFRLNTPVAAIGIRGTDFIVQTNSDVTRVAVQQGGVSIAAFNQTCTTQSFGACGGVQARDLAGTLTDAFLEVKSEGTVKLVEGQGRKVFALPRPEEPGVKTADGGKVTASLPAGLSGSQQLVWGRWGVSALVPSGYELIGQNEAFVLYRSLEQMNLPSNGFVNFKVREANIYARQGAGEFENATISNASFAVNFDKMQYSTKFDWSFGDLKDTMRSKGSVTDTGRLNADAKQSNILLSGALGAQGDEATYLFSKTINENVNAFGLINWYK